MNYEQVDHLVRRANPVPGPFWFDAVDGHVLDVERSMEMQVDDRPTAEANSKDRWRGPVIGIAAAAVVLIAGLVFINTGDDDIATPAPNATSLDTAVDLEQLVPGAYYADTDGVESTSTRGTFVIEGPDWIAHSTHGAEINDSAWFLVVEVEEVYTSVCEMSGRGPVAAGATAAAQADQFASNGFIVRETPTPVTAFGYEGHKLVMEVPVGCAEPVNQAWNGGVFQGRFYQDAGQILEYWFLDVEGTPVMVEATHFPHSSDEDLAELQAVLDTLVITP